MELLQRRGSWCVQHVFITLRSSMSWGKLRQEHPMETRLIIAYALIALMASFAILGLVILQRRRAAKLRRDAGQSPRP